MVISNASLTRMLILIWIITASFSLAKEPKYRVPNKFKPSSYDLRLELNPDQDKFSGSVVIDMVTQFNSKEVLLHAIPSRITNITSVMIDDTHVCEASFLEKLEMLNITCPMSLIKNEEYKLLIDYEGVYGSVETGNEYFGFYKSSYQTREGERYYIVTQFEPTFARTMFPCFDEPNYKAKFKIEVKHPENYNVLSNAEIHPETQQYQG